MQKPSASNVAFSLVTFHAHGSYSGMFFSSVLNPCNMYGNYWFPFYLLLEIKLLFFFSMKTRKLQTYRHCHTKKHGNKIGTTRYRHADMLFLNKLERSCSDIGNMQIAINHFIKMLIINLSLLLVSLLVWCLLLWTDEISIVWDIICCPALATDIQRGSIITIPFVVLSLLVLLFFRLLIELLDCPKIYGCNSLILSLVLMCPRAAPLFCGSLRYQTCKRDALKALLFEANFMDRFLLFLRWISYLKSNFWGHIVLLYKIFAFQDALSFFQLELVN